MSSQETNSPPGLLTFEYYQSNFFRVVHADGVFGGVTPTGYILMSFFSQMAPTPKVVSHEFDGKTLGQEVAREVSPYIHREMEVGVMMDLRIARSLFDWLKEELDNLEEVEKNS